MNQPLRARFPRPSFAYSVSPVAGEAGRRRKRAAPCLAAGLIGLVLGGCSLSLPLASLKLDDDDVTGSVSAPASPLSPRLTEEDWRRAQGALAVAVDPQGNGAPVPWDNPETRVKGSFAAAGPLYLKDDRICRPFLSDLTAAEVAIRHTGEACRIGPGAWAIHELKPVTAPK